MTVCAARWGVPQIPFPGAQVSWVTPPRVEALIAAIAGRQHGVITTAQLVRAGLGYSGDLQASGERTPAPQVQGRVRGRAAAALPGGRVDGRDPGVRPRFLPRLPHCRSSSEALAPPSHGHRRARADASPRAERRSGAPVPAPGPARHDKPRRDPGHHGAAHAGRPQRRLTPHQLANVIHEAAFRKLFDERAVRAAMQRANGRHNLHVLEQGARAQQGRQRRHAAASSRTASSLLTSRSGLPEPLVNTQSPGHRGRLPLAAPEPDRRGRRPRPHPPAHRTRGPRNETNACEPPATRSSASPSTSSTTNGDARRAGGVARGRPGRGRQAAIASYSRCAART